MAHMQPQAEEGLWIVGEDTHGNGFVIPADLIDSRELRPGKVKKAHLKIIEQYLPEGCSAPVKEAERKEGWCSRLSAPGYSDCTEWSGPFETEVEAMAHICDMHEIDGDGEDGAYYGTETECPKGEGHEVDAKSVAIEDPLKIQSTDDIVINFNCSKCGRSGSIALDLDEPNW